jgi:hypothetical protein
MRSMKAEHDKLLACSYFKVARNNGSQKRKRSQCFGGMRRLLATHGDDTAAAVTPLHSNVYRPDGCRR